MTESTTRLEAFSDGAFAIAITLLMLEGWGCADQDSRCRCHRRRSRFLEFQRSQHHAAAH